MKASRGHEYFKVAEGAVGAQGLGALDKAHAAGAALGCVGHGRPGHLDGALVGADQLRNRLQRNGFVAPLQAREESLVQSAVVAAARETA